MIDGMSWRNLLFEEAEKGVISRRAEADWQSRRHFHLGAHGEEG